MNKPSSLPVAHNDTVTHEKGNSAGTVTSCPHCHGNPTSPWVSIVRMVFTWPIKFYQIVFAGAPRVCRFEPTCSQYAIEAIERHGIFKGTAMALWRILRCNPWTPGGYDPVR